MNTCYNYQECFSWKLVHIQGEGNKSQQNFHWHKNHLKRCLFPDQTRKKFKNQNRN